MVVASRKGRCDVLGLGTRVLSKVPSVQEGLLWALPLALSVLPFLGVASHPNLLVGHMVLAGAE